MVVAYATARLMPTVKRPEWPAAKSQLSRSSCFKKCCTRPARACSADHTFPTTLPASALIAVSAEARPRTSSMQSKRRQVAALAVESVKKRTKTRCWSTVKTPRHGTLRAPRAGALRRAAHDTGSSIEAAPTGDHCTMGGAAAVSPASRTTSCAASHYCMMKCSAGGRLCVIPKGVLRFVFF